MRCDLHIHSRYSDGSMNIEEIIHTAKKFDVDYISVTDHDCLDSFENVNTINNVYKINAIFGVELSCTDLKRGRKVHILCYNPKKPYIIKSICEEVTQRRIHAGNIMAEKISEKYNISLKSIEKYRSYSDCIYKQHIMHALMDCGYTLQIYDDLYDQLFGKGKQSCYVKVKYFDVREVLSAVHDADGKAVIAHTGVYNNFELLDELISEKLIDGIEVWHPRHSKEDICYLYDKAITNNLIPTGGSDFHGMYNSTIRQIGNYFVPEEYINMLLD